MEDLEFTICEYLDGSLSAQDRAAVDAILASDSDARELLESHRKLSGAFKLLPPIPAVRWDAQSAQIIAAIADAEKLEFAISQYVDGTLENADRQAVEAHLAEDDQARTLHSHLDQLTSAMKSLQSDSAVHWDALTARISASIDRQQTRTAQTFKISRWRSAVPLAMAASVLIAAGISISIYLKSPGGNTVPNAQPVVVAEVTGPAAEIAANPVADVQIGPAPTMSADAMASHYDDDVVSRPARVIIASSARTDSDVLGLPY